MHLVLNWTGQANIGGRKRRQLNKSASPEIQGNTIKTQIAVILVCARGQKSKTIKYVRVAKDLIWVRRKLVKPSLY